MKNKYQRMSREEKKQCREKYYATSKGKEMKMRFLRLNLIGTGGILFSVFLVVSGYLSQELNWATWGMAILLTLFSILYLVGSFILKGKCLNQFAVKNLK